MYAEVNSASFWDERYKANQAGWDLKSANPVFVELLDKSEFLKPGKIMVAGCGKGYDSVAAAKKGYDVTAVDFSVEAISFAKLLAGKENVKINFLVQDLFQPDAQFFNYFDYVYEYVTYCSINPSRRKEFAEKISSVIKPGGRLITILFPVDKREGGPPFSIDVIEFYTNFSEFLKLEFSSKQINSIKPRKGREILQVYKKQLSEPGLSGIKG
jgi:SAM-dependent methyltransferase